MTNFIVSCDTCADMPKSWYEKNRVQYIIMKRILNGQEIAECFDKDSEFDNFYDGLKKGDLPTTAALNPFELKEYFEGILKSNPSGDIVHVCLSSGLSVTHQSCKSAADEINKTLKGRKIYIVDSLTGTLAIGAQVCELVELRDKGMKTEEAVATLTKIRDHQQAWLIMTDLFHLKRGGRISPAKAAIGSVLNIRPIIHLSAKGKIAMENKERGNIKAIKYLMSRMEKYGEKWSKENGGNFEKSTIWVVRTSKTDLYDQVLEKIRATYPDVHIKTGIVGAIIGTHLGCGAIGVMWQGAPRLDIE